MYIVDVARQYIGVEEGSNDHHRIIDEYNTINPLPRGYHVSYDDSWCAVFVSLCARRAGYGDFPFECGVFEMLRKWTGAYRIVSSGQPNDVIFFSYSHIGIIERVENGNYVTIEGNASNAVRRQEHSIGANYIRAFGRLPVAVPEDLELVARKVIAGQYGNQPERETRLKADGYDYNVVQSMVNSMLNVK